MTANPITQAEIRHQQRSTRPGSRGWRWFQRGLYVLALVVACVVYFGEWAGIVLQRDATPVFTALGPLPALLILYGLALQVVILLRTLAAASHSVTRETSAANWDTLILTGISGWQIVVGKWWATLRATARDWLLLLPIRVGLVTAAAIELTRNTLQFVVSMDPSNAVVPPSPIGLLLLVPVLTALTFGNAAVVAALGVLASVSVRRAVLALPAGVALMASVVVLTVLTGLGVQRAIYDSYQVGDIDGYERYIFSINVISTVMVTTVDNGTSLSFPFASYRLLPVPVDPAAFWQLFDSLRMQPQRGAVLWTSLALSLAGAAALVGILLWLATRAAVGLGALPASRQARGG